MSVDDVVDLLDRQRQFLDAIGVDELPFAVGRYLAALRAEPRIAVHLTDLLHEADDLGDAQRQRESGPAEAAARTYDILANACDPERLNKPAGRVQSGSGSFNGLYGFFEHPAVVPLDPREIGDYGRAHELVSVVEYLAADPGLAAAEDRRVQAARQAAADAAAEQQRSHVALLFGARTHPAIALMRLMALADLAAGGDGTVASAPRAAPGPVTVAALEVRAVGVVDLVPLITGALSRTDDGDDGFDRAELHAVLVELADAATRLHFELLRRVGVRRSRLALVQRFKARAEWHDRRRLRAIADDREADGGPEGRLRDEFATWLFDQGLNPLSEAVVGAAARSDVFDPSDGPSFIVEAKQYTHGDAARSQLIRAFAQALDTAANLHGPYSADEAFILIFRRGGSRLLLPDQPIQADGLTWHVVLVNLAPPSDDASQNASRPLDVTRQSLIDMIAEAQTERAAAEAEAAKATGASEPPESA